MDDSTEKNPQSISWWITSLAISVTCCAVLFVIFAGYLGDIKKQLASENTQLEQMALHQDKLLSEIMMLQHSMANNAPAAAAPAAIALPAATTASPAVPAVTEPAMAPVGTAAPTVTTPAPASPAAIPEVPAKK